MPPLGLRVLSWVVVGYNVLVILWGAVVRATGSGNGCGEHWPLCNGTFAQKWTTVASIIEFAHRATSGIAVILLLGLAVWVWRATPKRHWARFFAGASVVLTFNEALVGALLVKFGLTGENQSPWRAAALSLHLANTLFLLAALALTAHLLGRSVARMRGGTQWRHVAFTGVGQAATLLTGVTGSLAALGDTLYPAHSLREAFAQDFSNSAVAASVGGAHWILHIRWIHPALAFVAAGWLVLLVVRSERLDGGRLGKLVIGLVGFQIVLGIADVLLLAPVWLQIAHLFGADLLWIALVVLCARISLRPLGCMLGMCSGSQAEAQRAESSPDPVAV